MSTRIGRRSGAAPGLPGPAGPGMCRNEPFPGGRVPLAAPEPAAAPAELPEPGDSPAVTVLAAVPSHPPGSAGPAPRVPARHPWPGDGHAGKPSVRASLCQQESQSPRSAPHRVYLTIIKYPEL